jgi:hypothetical protein
MYTWEEIEPIDEFCDGQCVVPDVSVVDSRVVGHRTCPGDPEDHRGQHRVYIQQ